MTTVQQDYHTRRKLALIEDILKIVLNDKPIHSLVLENPQKCSFVTGQPYEFGDRHEIVWDNNFDFEIWHKPGKKPMKKVKVTSSTWFKVRDLIKNRFLDAEKLKW